MEPSYAAVGEALAACGLKGSVELHPPDDSYLGHVARQLALEPAARVALLGGREWVQRLEGLADTKPEGVLFGDAAGVLAGWPLRLPATGRLELCATDSLAVGEDVDVIEQPPGTRGLADLLNDAELIALGDRRHVLIASPLDQLRIERARGRRVQAGALLAVLEHRRLWPDGPRAPRGYTEPEAAAALEAWLSRTH